MKPIQRSTSLENSSKSGDSSAGPAAYIDKNHVLYVADSESAVTRNQADWNRGIRIGSTRDGKVTEFIPDPWTGNPAPATTAAEGVTADANGNVYGAEVTEQRVQRYVRR